LVIKHQFQDKMNISKVEKKIGISFKDKNILENAFIHRSYLNEAREKSLNSNERLEFLGDAVVSFMVSQHLFTSFPELPEGKLTNLRSAMVKTKTLATIAKALDLGSHLSLSRGEEDGGGRQNPSILCDCFEALVGAIFLDSGVVAVKKFLSNHLFILVPEIIKNRLYQDYKSDFQEKVQEKHKEPPTYKVLKEEGPDHDKRFLVGVFVEGKKMGEGEGKSKQEAEQKAAKTAFTNHEKIS